LIGRKRENLIVGWCGRFLLFVVPRQFSQDIGEWPENQILISDWTYFHCPGASLFFLSPATARHNHGCLLACLLPGEEAELIIAVFGGGGV